MKAKEAIHGIWIIPLMIVGSMIFMVWQIGLMFIFLGWTIPFAFVGLFAGLLIEGKTVPWECKTRWIRWLGMPFLKSHEIFCKVQGLKQRR